MRVDNRQPPCAFQKVLLSHRQRRATSVSMQPPANNRTLRGPKDAPVQYAPILCDEMCRSTSVSHDNSRPMWIKQSPDIIIASRRPAAIVLRAIFWFEPYAMDVAVSMRKGPFTPASLEYLAVRDPRQCSHVSKYLMLLFHFSERNRRVEREPIGFILQGHTGFCRSTIFSSPYGKSKRVGRLN